MTMSGDEGLNGLQSSWFALLSQAKKTCLVSKIGLKRIVYEIQDGREMIEEWKVVGSDTKDLLGRYWRKKSILGKESGWETEFGESMVYPQNIQEARTSVPESLLIRESNANPTVSSRCTISFYEWRIRNLPGPGSNYEVKCEVSTNSIVVSTKNRKYYKKLVVGDLERFKLKMEPSRLSSSFSNRTLVIQYKKEKTVIELERKIWTHIILPLKEEDSKPILSPSILNLQSNPIAVVGAPANSKVKSNTNSSPSSSSITNPNGCTHA